MSLYLKNAEYINPHTLEITVCNIKVNEGISEGIEFVNEIPNDSNTIDCTGKYVTKSFTCGHHHIYSALSRGMPQPPTSPKNFKEKLEYVWWELDKKLDTEMIKASALVTGMYCAKNGITFVIDHHSSPFAVEGSLEIIADALDKIGLSHLLCVELSDRDGKTAKEKGLSETENYLKTGEQGLVGLHASFTVEDDLLKKAVDLAGNYNSGIHIHTAEDRIDGEITKKKYNKSVIERFYNAGVLDFPKTILAHCIHINDYDRIILNESPVWIVQNPESNMNNNVGTFNAKGINENIFYGTDGMNSDMIRSAKAAYFAGKATENITPSKVYSRLRNVHTYLDNNCFKGDSGNNLVIFNYDSPTPVNKDNFTGHFIYGLNSSHVESVISGGKQIVKNQKLTNLNEEDILDFSKEMSKKLWKKLYN